MTRYSRLELPKERTERSRGAARAFLIAAALASVPFAAERFANDSDNAESQEVTKAKLCQNEPFLFKGKRITLRDCRRDGGSATLEIRDAKADGTLPETDSIIVPGVAHFFDAGRGYEIDINAVAAVGGKVCARAEMATEPKRPEEALPEEQKYSFYMLLAAAGAVVASFLFMAKLGRDRKI